MIDRVSHSVQKEVNRMLATQRSSSAQKPRNPLEPTECDQEKLRPNRGRVPDYLMEEKRMAVLARQERPRGLAKGEFRVKGQGSFKLAYDEAPVHRPHRKFIQTHDSPDQKLKSKRVFARPSSANPIIQGNAKPDQPQFESAPVRPRATQNYFSQVFSEPGPGERRINRPPES